MFLQKYTRQSDTLLSLNKSKPHRRISTRKNLTLTKISLSNSLNDSSDEDKKSKQSLHKLMDELASLGIEGDLELSPIQKNKQKFRK